MVPVSFYWQITATNGTAKDMWENVIVIEIHCLFSLFATNQNLYIRFCKIKKKNALPPRIPGSSTFLQGILQHAAWLYAALSLRTVVRKLCYKVHQSSVWHNHICIFPGIGNPAPQMSGSSHGSPLPPPAFTVGSLQERDPRVRLCAAFQCPGEKGIFAVE